MTTIENLGKVIVLKYDHEEAESVVIVSPNQVGDISKILEFLCGADQKELGGYYIWTDETFTDQNQLCRIDAYLAETLIGKTKDHSSDYPIGELGMKVMEYLATFYSWKSPSWKEIGLISDSIKENHNDILRFMKDAIDKKWVQVIGNGYSLTPKGLLYYTFKTKEMND